MNRPAGQRALPVERDQGADRGFRIEADPLPSWRSAKAAVERWLLVEALTRTSGNMAAASRLLGITKVAVLHAVRRHDLEHLTRPQRP